ncbi:MAG TPA: 16S rRNA (guanine(966)-N(2))-methyltransferase RsmD [candidate division Zixibacteria bacterium]|nr:16S rRNA (guanine(966)-N(2))-methyltransferase RsmD [candidate division Zixibacteria bacterium]
MRVISGKAKGHKLRRVPGDSTRPVTDRVKENLFNILGDWVIGTSWLDLFAGTGQVGIEALSRGAEHAVFVDSSRAAIRTIKTNLEHTQLSPNASVLHRNAFTILNGGISTPFDVVYVAPPQYKGIWIETLNIIDGIQQTILESEGLVIVQIDPAEYVDLELQNLSLGDRRKYGKTLLCFYETIEDYSTSS